MNIQRNMIPCLMITSTLLMASLPATASLVQSKVLVFNQSSQGFGDLNGVNEGGLSTASYYQKDTDGGYYRGNTTTGLGWAVGSASSEGKNRGVRLYSTFSLDDIIITYSGNGLAPTHIPGQLHITYSANFASHLNGNSTFSLGVLGSGLSYTGKTLYADGSAPLNGVFEVDVNFAVGTNLFLQVNSELTIANRLPEVQSVVQSSNGGFATVLGGSPVFNLPEFFSANSVDGTIVNNMYVGYNPLKATSVTEPGALFLLCSAIAGLLINRRRALKTH